LLLSIVIPCYNEEEVIKITHARLISVLEKITADFELIYVDDGSRDSTAQLLCQLQKSDSRVRVILLSRNFGHQMATTAGIEYSIGDGVVLIDADLQDPPELIQDMVEK
jgi:dolichol-phosphate mannosyltransferase